MTRETITREAEASPLLDLVSTAGLLLAGFPSADLVPLALDQVPGQVVPARLSDRGTPWDHAEAARWKGLARKSWGQTEGPQGRVRCSAGTVQLLAIDEARAERVRATRRIPPPLRFSEELDVDAPWARAFVDPLTGEVTGEETELVAPKRGRITEWSPKSRANLIRRMASTDWRPMVSTGVAPMVTLTYPGPWTAFAPTRDVVGRHLEAFKEAYRRQFCTALMIGPLAKGERRRRIPAGLVMGAWKVEYQGRGAPHLHLLLPIPHGYSLFGYQLWVAEEWHRIIWADRGADLLRLLVLIGHTPDAAGLIYAEHSRRSFDAGTAVDLAEGVKCRDPRRIALYFLGHSLSHAGGKEYQHRLPVSYAGRAGRWWGIWGLEDTAEDRYVTPETWWALREALGTYSLEQGRAAFQGGRMFGGWLAVDDGPSLLARIAGEVWSDHAGPDG